MTDQASRPRSESIRLRDVAADDLPTLFEFQCDPESNLMAAVIPRTKEAFFDIWKQILNDPAVVARVIELDGEVVGQVGCFQSEGKDCVGYGIARPFWGRGIASRALELLLEQVSTRPLHARAAKHNVASIRILEKNGFKIVGYEHSPATERYLECEEVLFLLE
jgi:RimJ/RimL family protein N-acetyltransferase